MRKYIHNCTINILHMELDICLTMPRWIILYDQMYQGDYFMYIYIFICMYMYNN